MRYALAAVFVFYGAGFGIVPFVLGGPATQLLILQTVVVLSGVAVFLAPTETMDARWFHVVPVLIGVETTTGMMLMAPRGGGLVVIVIAVGPLVGFTMQTRRQIVGHLLLESGFMAIPVLTHNTDAQSTMTILAASSVMWMLAAFVGIVWEHAEVQAQQLEELSRRDPLTGVANRRLLEERIAYELTRHGRRQRQLSVMVLDLNGFKEVNDALGHNAGDDLLRSVARALAGAVREQDTVARQGGDEFCVLLPETGPEEARQLVRVVKMSLALVSVADRPLSAAIGCATFPDDARDMVALFECADARQRADKPVRLAGGSPRGRPGPELGDRRRAAGAS